MKVTLRLLSALLLISGAASAINVPVPVEGATLNLNVQLQVWGQALEDFPSPNVGEQFFFRRVRLLAQGNFNKNFLYLIQLDTPNWGKNGDYGVNSRELIQDAWIAWNPTEGLYLDAGMLLIPFARHLLQSTTSYTNMDFHVDSINGPNRSPNTNGFRDMGVSLRGWALDKKIGYRFGAYNGNRGNAAISTNANQTKVNHGGMPRFAGFVNFNIIGSEEGAWLYQGLYFDKTVVSVGFGADYQSLGTIKPNGDITDHLTVSGDVFADFALSGDQEVIISGTGYRFQNGTNAADTGWAGFVDLGYRIGAWQPYISGEFFNGDGCDLDASGKPTTTCNANTRDLRIGSLGLNYWIKRNTLHLNSELASIRGTATFPVAGGTLNTTKHQTRFTLGMTMFF